jgi:hypothetical protein
MKTIYNLHGKEQTGTHMSQASLKRGAYLLVVFTLAGCANDQALHTTLNDNTQSLGNLLREQQAKIMAKVSTQEVYSEVVQADAHLQSMRELCKKPGKLSARCNFYTDLGDEFTAKIMFNAAKYYAVNGDAESIKILKELLARFTVRSVVGEANSLLQRCTEWDSFTPGWKAELSGDYATALKEYKAMDDQRALYKVGEMLNGSEGIPRDRKLAAEWYLRAAEKGYAPAQYRLGMLLIDGEGGKQEEKEGMGWLQKAADQKYGPAMEALAPKGR